MKREAERFQGLGSSGRTYTVIKWVEQVATRPISGSPRLLDGGHEFRLVDGSDVNELVPGKQYQIFKTDEIIERI
jgi:hypothetical protein